MDFAQGVFESVEYRKPRLPDGTRVGAMDHLFHTPAQEFQLRAPMLPYGLTSPPHELYGLTVDTLEFIRLGTFFTFEEMENLRRLPVPMWTWIDHGLAAHLIHWVDSFPTLGPTMPFFWFYRPHNRLRLLGYYPDDTTAAIAFEALQVPLHHAVCFPPSIVRAWHFQLMRVSGTLH